jgi:putative spermidine/putrescine transport system ATP-binding protein
MTVAQNVAYGLDMRGVPRAERSARVEAMLAKVQLAGLGHRTIRQISGGQQQRTALARALVINPSVLLLDEPLANLDAKLREEMRFYIRSLQRDFAITTIYVTHDQSEALVLADRIAVMMNGRLQQLAAPRDVYERPANATVAEFVGLTNFLDGDVTRNDRGALTIATSWASLPARGDADLPVGASVRITVRAEAFTIAPADDTPLGLRADGAHATARGRVGDVAYLGSLYDFPVHVADDLTLRVQTADPHCAQPGRVIDVRFDAARTWVVANRGEG